jgi:hypothetical protein
MNRHEMHCQQVRITSRVESIQRLILLRATLAYKAAFASDQIDHAMLRRSCWLMGKNQIIDHIQTVALAKLYEQWKHDGCESC